MTIKSLRKNYQEKPCDFEQTCSVLIIRGDDEFWYRGDAPLACIISASDRIESSLKAMPHEKDISFNDRLTTVIRHYANTFSNNNTLSNSDATYLGGTLYAYQRRKAPPSIAFENMRILIYLFWSDESEISFASDRLDNALHMIERMCRIKSEGVLSLSTH